MRRALLVAALAALVLQAAEAGAAVRLGVEGSKSRFHSLTGQTSAVNMDFISWSLHRDSYLDKVFAGAGPVPMIAFGTMSPSGNEAITPRAIARGKGDRVLISLNKAVARFGGEAYIRPFPEMNGHWNFYCAYNQDGSYRGRAHSTKSLRKAFRRVYLIVHGGSVADIDAALSASGMPKLNRTSDLPDNGTVRVVWNPQGYGSPDLKANSAAAYYPGNKYVDVVANDLYDIGGKVEWDANLALYRAYPGKPYAIGEWGLWGIDDPGFVQKMGGFVSAHPRVETIVYYRSMSGSTFDLASKPKSAAAYRKYILPLG